MQTTKRPARAKREALAEKVVIVADQIVNPVPLSLEATRDLCKVHSPTQEELAGMIQFILDRKVWSVGQYAVVVGAQPFEIWRILHAKYEPDGTLARIIWIIYQLDTNPSVLFDPFKLATWGMNYTKLPRRHDKARSEVEKLMKEQSYLSVKEIAQELAQRGTSADYRVIRHVAKRLGYRLKSGQKGLRTPMLLRPQSVWMHVDWTRPIKEIAQAVGCSPQGVAQAKAKLRAYPAATLLNAFMAAGRDAKAIEALARCYRKVT